VLFPFSDDVFAQNDPLRRTLSIIYALAVICLVLRLSRWKESPYPIKLALFSAAWFFIAMVPTFQVFELTANLHGSRYVYLGSAPLCLLMSALFYPFLTNQLTDLKTALLRAASQGINVALVASFVLITYMNNQPWVIAGNQLRELAAALMQQVNALKSNQKVVLLNLPNEYKGAHMLYNAATLAVLLQPPFTPKNICDRVITLEPTMFGEADLLNFARLQKMLAHPESFVFLKWQSPLMEESLDGKAELCSSSDKKCHPPLTIMHLPYAPSGRMEELGPLTHDIGETALAKFEVSNSDLIASPELNIGSISPLFLEVTISCHGQNASTGAKAGPATTSDPPALIGLSWLGEENTKGLSQNCLSLPLVPDGEWHSYLFDVSEHKSWLMSKLIKQVRLSLWGGPFQCQIQSARLIPANQVIPMLSAQPASEEPGSGLNEDAGGVCYPNGAVAFFKYDARQIKGAKAVMYEITKPNFWFEHVSGTFNDQSFSASTALRGTLPQLCGARQSIACHLPGGFYEMRVAAVDEKGNMVGKTSYPIVFQIGSL
jgi:hypothetical protein